jgi:hypothetical protein
VNCALHCERPPAGLARLDGARRSAEVLREWLA